MYSDVTLAAMSCSGTYLFSKASVYLIVVIYLIVIVNIYIQRNRNHESYLEKRSINDDTYYSVTERAFEHVEPKPLTNASDSPDHVMIRPIYIPQYILNEPNACQGLDHSDVVVLVETAANNKGAR